MSVQPKTSTPTPFMTMATNMSHVARFADVFPVAAIVSTLSAKSLRHMEQLAAPFLEFHVVSLPGVGHMPAAGGGREVSGVVVLFGDYAGCA